MKNILDPTTKDEIFRRIDKLTPESTTHWGKMNVNQGLRHMSMAFLIPTGELDPTPVNLLKMPKWLMKFFLLNVKPPKNRAETFKEMNMVANNIFPADFNTEKSNLKSRIEKFVSSSNLIPENKHRVGTWVAGSGDAGQSRRATHLRSISPCRGSAVPAKCGYSSWPRSPAHWCSQRRHTPTRTTLPSQGPSSPA